METLISVHNVIAILVLIFGLWTVISALTGVLSKRPYTPNDTKANLFFMIMMDIQLLLGIIALYFWITNTGISFSAMGDVMKDKLLRFKTIEHPMMMIIAWILVHVSRSASKKAATAAAKHKKVLIFSGIAFILILSRIPWDAFMGRWH